MHINVLFLKYYEQNYHHQFLNRSIRNNHWCVVSYHATTKAAIALRRYGGYYIVSGEWIRPCDYNDCIRKRYDGEYRIDSSRQRRLH